MLDKLSSPRRDTPDLGASSAAQTVTRPLPSPRLLTVDDVAEHIGSSTRHVRRLIDRGQLPVVRLGKLIRITPEDLARLIAVSRQRWP